MRVDTELEHVGSHIMTQGSKDHHMNNNTIMGYTTNKKTTKKTINASMWIC
jgi:hypothetical protein